MPKPKGTKRYWVDWETASTHVENGWQLDQDEPTGQRMTQREFAAPKEPGAAEEPVPGAAPPPDPGGSRRDLEDRRTQPRRTQPGPPDGRPLPPARERGQLPDEQGRAGFPPVSRQPSAPPDAGATILQAQERSGGDDAPESEGGALVPAKSPPTIAVATHNFVPEYARDPRLLLIREPDSERAAAYRVLRHHVVQQGNPHVIVVSSARKGERKTTCAVNLALALSECRRAKVLLCDAHFRRPQLAAIFRFQPPQCFADQVIAHRDRPMQEWSVVEIAPHGLHVAASSPRPEPLFDAPAFAFAMERLRMAGYDHIVVDAPSVLGSAEVNLLQDAADGVLLTALSGRSRRRDLRAAVEQLSPAAILGVVLLRS